MKEREKENYDAQHHVLQQLTTTDQILLLLMLRFLVCTTARTVGNHRVNKKYCNNLVSSGTNFVTTNTDQTVAGI
jgi:hypothetical protein